MTPGENNPARIQGQAVRQSNMELMRIVAMVLIIAGHFGSHSGFMFSGKTLSANRLWVEFFEIGGNISVNLFVLLSGYFRIGSPGFKSEKLIRLWLQLIFYSLGIYLVFVILGKDPLSLGEIIRRALPVSFIQWWFASTYFVLALFSPLLNRLLNSFSPKQYRGFLALNCICWCVIPTVTGQTFESNHLLWFIFLYSLAGYIRLYGVKTDLSAGRLIALSMVCAMLTFLSVVALDVLSMRIEYFEDKRFYFYDIQRIPLLVISVLLFLGFTRLRMKQSRLINFYASAMFGVYLIHDHEYVRYFFWLDLFHNMDHADDPLLILCFLGEVIFVLSFCSLIELARIHLLEKRYLPAVRRVAKHLDQKYEGFFPSAENSVNPAKQKRTRHPMDG